MSNLPLGELITTEQQKDAVHIAVAPVTAGEWLAPGHHVRIALSGEAVAAPQSEAIGIVDPFLKKHVIVGDRFWLFLYPGTITSLRHDWSHPAFPDQLATQEITPKLTAEVWLRKFADDNRADFDELISEAKTAGEYCFGSDTPYEDMAEFWRQLEIFAGQQFNEDHRERTSFRCAC